VGASARWQLVADAVARLGELVPGGDPAGEQYLLRFLAAGIRNCIELDDTVSPHLGRSIEHRLTWGLDNPDCTYRYTRVDPAGTYLLSGTAGTSRHLELQVNTGHQGDGNAAGWRAVSTLTRDQLAIGPRGDLGVVLSATVPPDGVDWLNLTPDASFLLVREYSSDWQRERPAELVIERVDTPLPPAPLTAPDLDARVALLVQWLDVGARCWDATSRAILEGGMADIQPFLPPPAAAGQKGQAYGMGAWRCEPDEALVVRLQPPRCRYWSVSLCDEWWQSIDAAERQSSLNDVQAAAGPDGSVTMVVAHEDPGVQNWLDPGGRRCGTIAVRYLLPDDPAAPLPGVRIRRARLERSSTPLPPSAGPLLSPAARADALRDRHRAYLRRLRW
jgi:hypothetical protein